jgi:hemoglobin-like flavoprotein
MENYTNVIKNIYKSDLFIENIDKHHKDFQTKKEKLNINNIFLLKTLRMTITDTQ